MSLCIVDPDASSSDDAPNPFIHQSTLSLSKNNSDSQDEEKAESNEPTQTASLFSHFKRRKLSYPSSIHSSNNNNNGSKLKSNGAASCGQDGSGLTSKHNGISGVSSSSLLLNVSTTKSSGYNRNISFGDNILEFDLSTDNDFDLDIMRSNVSISNSNNNNNKNGKANMLQKTRKRSSNIHNNCNKMKQSLNNNKKKKKEKRIKEGSVTQKRIDDTPNNSYYQCCSESVATQPPNVKISGIKRKHHHSTTNNLNNHEIDEPKRKKRKLSEISVGSINERIRNTFNLDSYQDDNNDVYIEANTEDEEISQNEQIINSSYKTPDFIMDILKNGNVDTKKLKQRIKSKNQKKASWKLIHKGDKYLYHGMNKEESRCTLCDIKFAKLSGYASHPTSSKDHQLAIIAHLIKNNKEFPSHCSFIKPDEIIESLPKKSNRSLYKLWNIRNTNKKDSNNTNSSQALNSNNNINNNNDNNNVNNGNNDNNNMNNDANISGNRKENDLDEFSCAILNEPILNDQIINVETVIHGKSSPVSLIDTLKKTSICKGYYIKDLKDTTPPFLFEKFRLKILGNTLHDQRCLIYVDVNNQNGRSNQCNKLFSKENVVQIKRILKNATIKFDHKSLSTPYNYWSRKSLINLLNYKNAQTNQIKLKRLNWWSYQCQIMERNV